MENIISLTQKDLHKLGKNLNGVNLCYNCSIYESILHDNKSIAVNLGYEYEYIERIERYQVAYSFNEFGNAGQLHRLEIYFTNKIHITTFVYFTNIRYKD